MLSKRLQRVRGTFEFVNNQGEGTEGKCVCSTNGKSSAPNRAGTRLAPHGCHGVARNLFKPRRPDKPQPSC